MQGNEVRASLQPPGAFRTLGAEQSEAKRSVPPEVTDLDNALEPWKKVYLPVVLR
jgi:hypothetical protein